MKSPRQLSKANADLLATMTRSARDIIAERKRQIDTEGYTSEHDDEHRNGEIADAATDWASKGQCPVPWSWAVNKKDYPRRRQLVIGAALILAEIDRLDRKTADLWRERIEATK